MPALRRAPAGPLLREERPGDLAAVAVAITAAFGRPDETKLVAGLATDGDVVASLVAEIDDIIVGHVLFSRLPIEHRLGRLAALSLAPLAVVPQHQRQGIGSALVRTGLARCRERGEAAVVVLGEPSYYGRFGFSAEAAQRLAAPFSGSAFMALELVPGSLAIDQGRVRYPAAFGLG
ncbi:MAG: GNAT family N-acetyltransferase [Kiloniellales bacterium]